MTFHAWTLQDRPAAHCHQARLATVPIKIGLLKQPAKNGQFMFFLQTVVHIYCDKLDSRFCEGTTMGDPYPNQVAYYGITLEIVENRQEVTLQDG